MARKPTDKQLFKMKNEWLGQFYEEVKLDTPEMGCYIWITDVQKLIDKISGQAKQGAVYYIIYLSR